MNLRRLLQECGYRYEVRVGHEDPDEKAISMALADMEAGNVQVQLQHETVADAIENELENETETKTPDVDFDSQENTVAQPSQE